MATKSHRGKTNFALPALFRRGYTKAAVESHGVFLLCDPACLLSGPCLPQESL
jgi:hypothetical protein